MVDLSVKFAGLDFKNPISVAAHGPGMPDRNLLSDRGRFRSTYEAVAEVQGIWKSRGITA